MKKELEMLLLRIEDEHRKLKETVAPLRKPGLSHLSESVAVLCFVKPFDEAIESHCKELKSIIDRINV